MSETIEEKINRFVSVWDTSPNKTITKRSYGIYLIQTDQSCYLLNIKLKKLIRMPHDSVERASITQDMLHKL
jgi:hypothetical protein